MKGEPKGFWAKLNQDENGKILEWNPLLAHSADVAAVTEALLKRTILNQRIANLIGWAKLSDVHIARLSALAAIHDAGKVNHGFQNKMYKSSHPRAGHVSPIVELLDADVKYQEELLIPLGIEQVLQWFPDQSTAIHFLLATWGHHGRPVPVQHHFKATLWTKTEKRNPKDELRNLGDAVQSWFPEAYEKNGKPFPADPVLQHTFNGLLTLADWLGSDPKFFSFSETNDFHIEKARKNAGYSIKKLALDASESREKLGNEPIRFSRFADFKPYDIQQQCLDLPIHKNGSLSILESDTGSGKTEAAIARFVRLYQEGLVDGMYFAVPTRSAATQLYERVFEATKKVFPDNSTRPPVVQAVSGYIKADAEEAQALPDFNVSWPEDTQDYLRERGWAAEHPKRYLAGAIVVGTIDQVFLSTLQVNHAHMRAAALLRHFLVVDEVHSSDAYMTKLLDRVLDYHLSAGGHALLMSATLGTASRYRLVNKNHPAIPAPEDAKSIAYPLITHVGAQRENPEEFHAASSGKQKKVITEVKPDAASPDDIAAFALEQAKSGARVLIIRNLVKDCIKTQKTIEELTGSDSELLFNVNGVPAPHHSRFAPDDRKRLDGEIEKTFGKNTEKSSVIAVATQTVEQSLDIDADILITDLCPMDVLLQRIGRLHRHARKRPEGFETAKCIILTPIERDMSNSIDHNGKGSKGNHGLGTVYQDLRVLEATWRVLEDEEMDAWHIPNNNRELVERATHPKILHSLVEELGDNWVAHQQHIAGQEFADKQLPGLVGVDFNKPFGESGFADDLNQVKTRLGRDDYRVSLPEKIDGPFGEKVSELKINEWQINVVPEETELDQDAIQPFKGGFSFSYYGKNFRYDRFGLELES
jgi:CRISPR-associated endonuclease/helicase Cas3